MAQFELWERETLNEFARDATRRLIENSDEIERLRDRVEHLRGALKTASGWCYSMTSDDSIEYDWLKRADLLLELCREER